MLNNTNMEEEFTEEEFINFFKPERQAEPMAERTANINKEDKIMSNKNTNANTETKLVIEKGIPLPPAKGSKSSPVTELIRTMVKEDSLKVAEVPKTLATTAKKMTADLRKTNPEAAEVKFATRKVDGGFRIWRIS